MNGGEAEREGLTGGGCDLKYKNVLHCKFLGPCSMNGGAAEDRSGAAIKKVSEERERKAHMVCGAFRMIFSPDLPEF